MNITFPTISCPTDSFVINIYNTDDLSNAPNSDYTKLLRETYTGKISSITPPRIQTNSQSIVQSSNNVNS